MKTICLAIVLLLLYSCKKDSETIEAAPETTEAGTPVAVIKTANTTPLLIETLIANKKQVKNKLSSLSPEEANNLYDLYKKGNDSIVGLINNNEQNILENYYSYVSDEHGKAKYPPDSIAKKEALLKNAGLEIWDIGEGLVEIRTVPNFYLSLFKGRVTKDYEDFITLLAKDNENLYAADAGLAISFKEVGGRVLNWEKFINTHPYSKLTPQAIEFYKEYQNGYLLGMDNSPTVNYQAHTIYPENLQEFEAFSAVNPLSPTTAIIKLITQYTGNKEDINGIVEKEQEKLIDKLITDTTPDYR